MTDVVQELGGLPNATHLPADIKNLIQFEETLAFVILIKELILS